MSVTLGALCFASAVIFVLVKDGAMVAAGPRLVGEACLAAPGFLTLVLMRSQGRRLKQNRSYAVSFFGP